MILHGVWIYMIQIWYIRNVCIHIYKYRYSIDVTRRYPHVYVYIYIRTYMNCSAYMYPRTDMYMPLCLCSHIVMHQPDARRGVCGDGHGSSEATFGTRSTTARCADGVALCGSQGKGWMGWIVAVVESWCAFVLFWPGEMIHSSQKMSINGLHEFFFVQWRLSLALLPTAEFLQFSPTGRR